jgi:hypothetical protein
LLLFRRKLFLWLALIGVKTVHVGKPENCPRTPPHIIHPSNVARLRVAANALEENCQFLTERKMRLYNAMKEDACASFVMLPTRWSTYGKKSSLSTTVKED